VKSGKSEEEGNMDAPMLMQSKHENRSPILGTEKVEEHHGIVKTGRSRIAEGWIWAWMSCCEIWSRKPRSWSLGKMKKEATWPQRCRSERTVIRTRTNERRKN